MRVHVVHVTLVARSDVLSEIIHLGRAFEIAGVKDPHLHEDEVLENPGEHAEHAKQGMQAQPVKAVDQDNRGLGVGFEHCDGLALIRPPGVGSLLHCHRGDQVVQAPEILARLLVMAFDEGGRRDQEAGDQQREPAAFKELDHAEHEEDEDREHSAHAVHGHARLPAWHGSALLPPMTHHA